MKEFKHRKLITEAPGRSLIPRGSQKCSWCTDGTIPRFSEQVSEGPYGSIIVYSGGICERCVKFYKGELTSTQWQRFRKAFLASFPYCKACSANRQSLIKDTLTEQEQGEQGKRESRARGAREQEEQGKPIVLASVCDHVIPWRYRPDLFYVESNIQSLCRTCHDIKSRQERISNNPQ